MQYLDEANAVSAAEANDYDERINSAPTPAAVGTATSGNLNALSQPPVTKKPIPTSAISSSSSSKDAAKKIPHSQKKGDALSKLSGSLL